MTDKNSDYPFDWKDNKEANALFNILFSTMPFYYSIDSSIENCCYGNYDKETR